MTALSIKLLFIIIHDSVRIVLNPGHGRVKKDLFLFAFRLNIFLVRLIFFFFSYQRVKFLNSMIRENMISFPPLRRTVHKLMLRT